MPAQTQARRMEVRLVRRLPAELLDCEDELLALAGASRDRLFPRGIAGRRSRARTISRWSKARSPPPHDAERIQRDPRESRDSWSRSARARPPAGSRRCATSPTSRNSSRRSTPTRVHLHARQLDPDRAHVPVDFELQRLPDQQASAPRGDQRVPPRPQAANTPPHSVCIECKLRGNVCVMVAQARPVWVR